MLDEATKNIVEGRKTFFIVPDVSLLPETYLEDYMARGYETYIIGDDRYCPLDVKVDIIIQTFTDSILFFWILGKSKKYYQKWRPNYEERKSELDDSGL